MSIKLNIASPTSFTAHRSGWGYAMNHLMKYHDYDGVLLDDFLDITFGYNYEINKKNKTIPYKKPWIGFLHHPPSICPWYEESYKHNIDINNFLNSEEFQYSAKYCQCLFVLSDYLKKYLIKNIPCLKNVPIISIKHPTEPGAYKWDYKKFKTLYKINGLKVVSIGYFLRNLTSLFFIKSSKNLDKIILPSHLNLALSNLDREIAFKNLENTIDHSEVKIIDWQNNQFYDKLLEQSLVFLDLYDTSCNNAIIESMIRSCPILVNRHPAIEEYLGIDYPLFYEDLSQTKELINYDLIQNTSEYLNSLNLKELSGDYFGDTFAYHLTDLGVFNKKTIKTQTHKHQASKQNYRLISKTTDFKHKFGGWSWVTTNIEDMLAKEKSLKKSDTLYLNDFIDHTFKVDNATQSKELIINNKKYRAVRGYNLFPYKNSDLLNINDEYYLWDGKENSWIYHPESEELLRDVPFLRIPTYKTNYWIGFFHNPPNMPKWFDYGQNLEYMMQKNIDLILSLHHCKKIFVLSKHLKEHIDILLKKYNLKIPVVCLKHPAPASNNRFDYNKFLDKPKIVQLGYWLRKMHSFWQIDSDLEKIWLYGHPFAIEMLKQEKLNNKKYQSILSNNDLNKIQRAVAVNESIKIKNVNITRIDDKSYDEMISSSVIYTNMYDSSANNAVLECIATQTPLLINRIPSIEEYLGPKYPLYFRGIREANRLIRNKHKILEAHLYLKEHDELRSELSIQTFLSNFKREIDNLCKK
jgi:hypothetical protein